MKPSKEVKDAAASLMLAKSKIDPQKVYRLENPAGGFFDWTGAKLIETAEAYAEMAAAGESGDKARIRRAVERISLLMLDD